MTSISLQDAGVWDDAALIRSWDEALQEYKKYHSIHARGEKVEKVLSDFLDGNDQTHAEVNETADDGESVPMLIEENASVDTPNGVFGKSSDQEVMVGDHTHDMDKAQQNIFADSHQHQHQHAAQESLVTLPDLVPGQDPALKNMLMSWYWAGYYSGLHAAQKKDSAPA